MGADRARSPTRPYSVFAACTLPICNLRGARSYSIYTRPDTRTQKERKEENVCTILFYSSTGANQQQGIDVLIGVGADAGNPACGGGTGVGSRPRRRAGVVPGARSPTNRPQGIGVTKGFGTVKIYGDETFEASVSFPVDDCTITSPTPELCGPSGGSGNDEGPGGGDPDSGGSDGAGSGSSTTSSSTTSSATGSGSGSVEPGSSGGVAGGIASGSERAIQGTAPALLALFSEVAEPRPPIHGEGRRRRSHSGLVRQHGSDLLRRPGAGTEEIVVSRSAFLRAGAKGGDGKTPEEVRSKVNLRSVPVKFCKLVAR